MRKNGINKQVYDNALLCIMKYICDVALVIEYDILYYIYIILILKQI